jgi:hypothetical protein
MNEGLKSSYGRFSHHSYAFNYYNGAGHFYFQKYFWSQSAASPSIHRKFLTLVRLSYFIEFRTLEDWPHLL